MTAESLTLEGPLAGICWVSREQLHDNFETGERYSPDPVTPA
jgi:hypothetical protein